MTIPQILSSIGYGLFTIALAFLALHTFNLIIPGVDYYIPSSEIGMLGYLVALPVLVVGFVIGMIGTFWERLHERWLERQRE
jgi:hypothetical protein